MKRFSWAFVGIVFAGIGLWLLGQGFGSQIPYQDPPPALTLRYAEEVLFGNTVIVLGLLCLLVAMVIAGSALVKFLRKNHVNTQ